MTKVFIDIENALQVPFLSGIQRVVSELVPRLVAMSDDVVSFVPVRYCRWCRGWIRVSNEEIRKSISMKNTRGREVSAIKSIARSPLLAPGARSYRTAREYLQHDPASHANRLIPSFAPGSIFLDLDASWHNQLSRKDLLPALRDRGVKLVAIHYDSIPIQFPHFVQPDARRRFREHFEAKLACSHLILCISRTVAAQLRGAGTRQSSIRVLRLGDRFSVAEDDDAGAMPPNIADRFIICVGTLEPRKNHATLLSVYDRLIGEGTSLDLVLVGREGWMCESIREGILANPNYRSRLHWLRSCPDGILRTLYERAFLSVVPSFYEGYGLPVTESLAAGCVTLSSGAGALREAGGEYADYFDPDQPESLYRTVRRFVDDDSVHLERKRQLLSRVEYTWNETAAELFDHCSRLALSDR